MSWSDVTLISFKFWHNDVKVVKETKKSVKLEVTGSKSFNRSVGKSAWFPKRGLTLSSCRTSVTPKLWLVDRTSKQQEYVAGFRE